MECAVVNVDACKNNSHITDSLKKWKGLPSLFDQSQTMYEKPKVLGPSNFKTISFNLEKEYNERNKNKAANTRALIENWKKEGKTTITFDLSNFQI